MKPIHYQRLTVSQLQSLATDRFGSLQSASLMAQRACQLGESITRNKTPWIRALEQPLNPEDLGAIATHERWVKDVRDHTNPSSAK
jgi:hypothetical protein